MKSTPWLPSRAPPASFYSGRAPRRIDTKGSLASNIVIGETLADCSKVAKGRVDPRPQFRVLGDGTETRLARTAILRLVFLIRVFSQTRRVARSMLMVDK